MHVLLGLKVTTRFEQFMNNHDKLNRRGLGHEIKKYLNLFIIFETTFEEVSKISTTEMITEMMELKFMETRLIPRVTEFISQRRPTSL